MLGGLRGGAGRISVAVPGVAALVFWLAYDNGSYGLASRNALAIAVWWAIAAIALIGLSGRRRWGWPTLAIGGLLLGLAALSLASAVWAPSTEKAFDEFNRVTLYLGVFALATLLLRAGAEGAWCDGLALAIAAIGGVALASRLFPGLFGEGDLIALLPSAATRLSFPLGYWNGLGIFLALGVPLLLRISITARTTAVRAAAVASIPAMVAAIFLTSSRGAAVTLAVAVGVFIALTADRWLAGYAVGISALAAGASVFVLGSRDALVDGPLGSAPAIAQGRQAAIIIAAIAVAAGLLFASTASLVRRTVPQRSLPRPLLLIGLAAVVVGTAAADPIERFREFREPLPLDGGDDPFVVAHLLSGSGSGRWQFWSAAVDQFRDEPLHGGGGGTYEAWWAAKGSLATFVRDAHSLYLEALGELGPLGLLLTVGLVTAGIGVGVATTRRLEGHDRVTAAALTGVWTGFSVAAGVDWMWELTVVATVAIVAIAILAGWSRPRDDASTQGRVRRYRQSRALRIGVVAVALAVICGQGVPLLAQYELERSRDAVRDGDLQDALDAARAARAVQPWAATPYLQLALVHERRGRLGLAERFADRAIERDREDWRLWLIEARLSTKLGRIEDAQRALQRAIQLNPRSPLFAGMAPS